MRKRKTQRFNHDSHGRSRTHDGTMPAASAHTRLRQQKFLLKHAARSQRLAKTPDITRANVAPLKLPREHRSTRHDDRRDVHAARTHHKGWRCFVTSTHQYNAIDWIRPNR